MVEHEKVIKKYFKAWIDNTPLVLSEIFDNEILYSECYGPEYYGLDIIEKWFYQWHTYGNVLVWDIKQFIHKSNITAVEWYFKFEYKGDIQEFNGVSLIEFNDFNRIIGIKEFQSKLPHYYPYK